MPGMALLFPEQQSLSEHQSGDCQVGHEITESQSTSEMFMAQIDLF
jgi:hypothetical protein